MQKSVVFYGIVLTTAKTENLLRTKFNMGLVIYKLD